MREEAHKGRMCLKREYLNFASLCVLFFLFCKCALRPRLGEVKNKSPVPQPSTYSGFSEVIFAMLVTSDFFPSCSWFLLMSTALLLFYPIYCSHGGVMVSSHKHTHTHIFRPYMSLRFVCAFFEGTLCSLPSCVCVCFQAQVAFLQGERKGQENMKQDLVRRIKMLEYALKQER